MLNCSPHNRVTHRAAHSSRHRSAFTLVELLVVLAVIAILIALLLPAVQSAREAARVLECKNHLKQIGLAWQNHHEAWKFFPTGGWSAKWAGDPDQGFDKRQPGGWAFNTLPYLEERSIHDFGKGASYGGSPDKKDLLAQAAESVASVFLCPSRRSQTNLFVFTQQSASFANINLRNVTGVWRGDYCANAGDQRFAEQLAAPALQYINDVKFPFDKTDDPSQIGYSTGVSYYQSMISIRQITDGTSHKYAVGEKFLYIDKYYTGDDLGDNEWLWTGWNSDLYRTAGVNYQSTPPPNGQTRSPVPPQRDMLSSQADATTQHYEAVMWGGPHQAGFNMVYCDGSVHVLDYGIDLLLHRRMHNRFWGY